MGNSGVDESCQEERVAEVCLEGGALSDRTRDNGSSRGRKSPLEEEKLPCLVVVESKCARTDKRVRLLILSSAIGDAETVL